MPFSIFMADKKDSSEETNRLFLLDGMALVYRAHFALIRSPIYTSGGMNTSALFGFVNTLLELIENRNPTHLAVAFDTADPTFRHKEYPEYKANRDAMPEDLSLQIPHVKRFVEAFHIPVLECPGWEADDVIGTLARKADAEGGYETFMVTPDKDFAQLVTDTTKMYKPGRQGNDPEILDRAAICENWLVEDPLQTIDILGLWGDSSDNIPGVPGVGEKTAKKLVAQFGSVETLLENTDQLKGKQKENVENNREQALLSKKLVTIITEAPVEVGFEDLKITEPDEESLKELFVEFEFNSFGKRFFGEEFKAGRSQGEAATASGSAKLKTIKDFKKDYLFIRAEDDKDRAKLIADLAKAEAFCFDLETDGLDEKVASIIGIAFSTQAHTGAYVEVPDGNDGKKILQEMAPLFTESKAEKIGHNLKFDIGVLHWNGIHIQGPIFDTMLAHILVEPDQRHKMDYLSESLLGYTPIAYADVFGTETEKTGQMNLFEETEMTGGPEFEKIAEYAAEDADVTWQLAEILSDELKELGQEQVFYEIECPSGSRAGRDGSGRHQTRHRHTGKNRFSAGAENQRTSRCRLCCCRRRGIQSQFPQAGRRSIFRPAQARGKAQENQNRPIQDRRTNSLRPGKRTCRRPRSAGLSRSSQVEKHLRRCPPQRHFFRHRQNPYDLSSTAHRHRSPRIE